MPIERYFVPTPFRSEDELIIRDQEFHHFSRVMRGRIGDVVECVNGQGQLAEGIVKRVDKHAAVLTIDTLVEKKSKTELILVQALPRFNRLEFILEKGTELGVSEFWLFPSARSEKEALSANQQERSLALTIAALKQCGRLDLPKIILRKNLSECTPGSGTYFFGDVRENAPKIGSKPLPLPIYIFIGPESGFSDQEIDHLEQNIRARGIRLHQNILRVDTAALTAVALFTQFPLDLSI